MLRFVTKLVGALRIFKQKHDTGRGRHTLGFVMKPIRIFNL